MAIKEDLTEEVKKILSEEWETKDGRVVPVPSDIGLGNKSTRLEKAVVFYADMSGSTSMVDSYKWWFSAEIYKIYLLSAARIIKYFDGVITAYDGDRVMAVFIGEGKCDRAAKAALKLNWAVKVMLKEKIKEQYENTNFVLDHKVGIDMSDLHAARTGVRGDNDLVWVGKAANHAAKLTSLSASESLWVTKEVYSQMTKDTRESDGKSMWVKKTWTQMNDREIYSSTWHWSL